MPTKPTQIGGLSYLGSFTAAQLPSAANNPLTVAFEDDNTGVPPFGKYIVSDGIEWNDLVGSTDTTTLITILTSVITTTVNASVTAQLAAAPKATGSSVMLSDGTSVEAAIRALQAKGGTITASAPTAVAPTVVNATHSGVAPVVGDVLTAAYGAVTSTPSGDIKSSRGQWMRYSVAAPTPVPIPNATALSYQTVSGDIGYTPFFRQVPIDNTLNNLEGQFVDSPVLGVVSGVAATNTVGPSFDIFGPQVDTLTANLRFGTWSIGSGTVASYAYLFKDNGVAIGTRTTVPATVTSVPFPLANHDSHTITADVQAISALGTPSAIVPATNSINVTAPVSVVTTTTIVEAAGTLLQGATSGGTIMGANIHLGGGLQSGPGTTADNTALANLMKAYGFKSARMDLGPGMDMNLWLDQASKLVALGISVEACIQTTYQSDDTIYTGSQLATVQQDSYNQTVALIQQVGALVFDFEFLNEVQLRQNANAQVGAFSSSPASTYVGKTAFTSFGAILKGMGQAVIDQRTATGRKYRGGLGGLGMCSGFLNYMKNTAGVAFDYITHHDYPNLTDTVFGTDTYFGTGGRTLLQEMAFYFPGTPVRINEFNAGDIYGTAHGLPAYNDVEGATTTNNVLKSMDRHLPSIMGQCESISVYEFRNEPSKAPPENYWGIFRDLQTPKLLAALWQCYNGVAPASAIGVLNSIGFTGPGINMGNCLEAPHEGDWGAAFVDSWATTVKNAGFGFVRLPVRWTNHAALTVDATLDSTFLTRVQHVVTTLMAAGLGVIMDCHHYRQLDGDPLDSGESAVAGGVSLVQRLVNIWTQLGSAFSSYGPSLYFEPYNEPHGNQEPGGSTPWNTTYPQLVTAIRATNPTRKIVLGPTDYNDSSALSSFTAPSSNANIIITCHDYQPDAFTMQGEYGTSYPTGVAYNAASMDPVFRGEIDTAVAWGQAHGFTMFIGEMGVTINADAASRVAWMTSQQAYVASKGLSYAVWNFDADYGLWDTTVPTAPVANAALIAAALGASVAYNLAALGVRSTPVTPSGYSVTQNVPYPVIPGQFNLVTTTGGVVTSSVPITPATMSFGFYKNGALLFPSNGATAATYDPFNFPAGSIASVITYATFTGYPGNYNTDPTKAQQYTVVAPGAALALNVANASLSFTIGTAITPIAPVTGAGGTGTLQFAISPAVPPGLSFNPANATLTGTPSGPTSSATYTITLTDSAGDTPAAGNVTISVSSAAAFTFASRFRADLTFAGQMAHHIQHVAGEPFYDTTTFPESGLVPPDSDGGATIFGTKARVYKANLYGKNVIVTSLAQNDGYFNASVGSRRTDIYFGGDNSLNEGDGMWCVGQSYEDPNVTGDPQQYAIRLDFHGNNDTGGMYLQMDPGTNTLTQRVYLEAIRDPGGSPGTPSGYDQLPVGDTWIPGRWMQWAFYFRPSHVQGQGLIEMYVRPSGSTAAPPLITSTTAANLQSSGDAPCYFKWALYYPLGNQVPANGARALFTDIFLVRDNSHSLTPAQLMAQLIG